MTTTFEQCTLPEVCFHSFGLEPRQSIKINDKADYEANFIDAPIEPKNDASWLSVATEYKELKAELKAKEKRLAQLKDALISMADRDCVSGAGIMVERCERKGAIRYGAIPQLISVDLEHYRDEPTIYWKVTEI